MSLEMTNQGNSSSDDDSDNAANETKTSDNEESDSDSETKTKTTKATKESDSDSDNSNSASDDDDDDDSGSTAASRKKERARKKKRKERLERGGARRAGKKRANSSGPFSPDAQYRTFKIFSLAMSVFIFITAVICFQWNCLYAHMCFVVEDPAVPQPQSNWIVPVIGVSLALGMMTHLFIMSESTKWCAGLGLVALCWSITVMVLGSICFGNAEPSIALTLSEAAWEASPFSTAVIQNYYVDIAALQTKMEFNLNSLGGCAIALSILQFFHSACCLVFCATLLRS